MFNKFFAGFLLLFSLIVVADGQTKPVVAVMPISEVKEGMRGTARTVFKGSEAEEFGVEVLGVIPNWIGPRQDVIIGKLSGANAERTFVFAGMSGSPVYVDGKLIGAISYSFPFAKEPICGITPYDQMTSIMEQAIAEGDRPSPPRTFSFAELQRDTWQPAIEPLNPTSLASGFPANSRLSVIAGQSMMPIATPLYLGGISPDIMRQVAPGLTSAGILPVAAASSSDTAPGPIKFNEKTLLGGDSVMVFLSRGDVQIGAAGTVTHRDGDRVYAFGHPFFGLGAVNAPMSESSVVTVIPNANNSFKLAVPSSVVGAMTQDRATAIYGQLGRPAEMLPVRVKFINSRGRASEIKFESVLDELLTPLIVNAGIANTITAQERSLGEISIDINGEIKIKGETPIKIDRRFTGQQAVAIASSAPAVPLAGLLRANFAEMDISGIDLTITAKPGGSTGVLEQISVDRDQVKAGETVNISVVERTQDGMLNTVRVPVVIPAGTAPGKLTIKVGDGSAVQENSAVTQFTPRNAAEFISTYNKLKRSDRLYAVVSRNSTGTVIGSSELPDLPPSMLATLNNDRTAGGSKATVNSIINEIEIPVTRSIITGSQSLTIEVIR